MQISSLVPNPVCFFREMCSGMCGPYSDIPSSMHKTFFSKCPDALHPLRRTSLGHTTLGAACADIADRPGTSARLAHDV